MPEAYMPKAKRSDHCTPQVVKEPLVEFFGGPFDLDPCGSTYSILHRRQQYLIGRGEDGLALPWIGTSARGAQGRASELAHSCYEGRVRTRG